MTACETRLLASPQGDRSQETPAACSAPAQPLAENPFAGLRPNSYGLILADPPWRFLTYSDRGQTKAVPYATMSRSELLRLPVWRLAAPNCALLMWSTPEQIGFAVDLMKRWGFECKTTGWWTKLSRGGEKQHFGKGRWWREAGEPWIFGTIGAPKNHSHRERNTIISPTRETSRKPDALHAQLERMFPRVRKLELFARQRRDGWDSWGNEMDFFPASGAQDLRAVAPGRSERQE